MNSLDFAKKALQHVWAEFINHFDAAANVDLLFPKELIDESMMEVILNAKPKKDANRAFLSHLRSNATVESLWKLCELLRDTAQDHQRHDSLAKSLEDELKQFTVPLSSPEAVQKGGRGGDGPSYSQATTSELTNKVFSDENAASRLGIVAALDLSKGTSQPIVHTDAYLAKDPPHRKVEAAFFRLQSRLASIFNKHCDTADLKLFLRLRQKNEEWPFKELEVEDIDSMKDIRTIFGKICIDWLNTEAFIRLIDVLPDEKSHDDAKQHLEDYHKLLGFFGKCVLLSHIPKHDARLEYFCSCMFPQLRVTYDINMEDFDVSKLFKQQNFWSKTFEIPEEAFHYIKAVPTNSTLVTWALAISIEKAFKLFQRVTHVFWSLKEHLIIKVEIESDGIFQLHLKGRNLPYQLKKALQGNQNLLACTEHVSRQFLALVDYSHLQRKGTENEKMDQVSFIEKPVVKTELSPYLDIKTEPSPDVSLEPSSKRFMTETDYLAYEQLLKKKSEEEHSLLSSLAEYQTLNEDLRTKVQQMEKDLSLKVEENRRGVEGELKVSRKGKGKAVTTDGEVEEKVSFKEKSVEKTELSPDAKSEPSSKSFKTARPDYLTYEPPLEKKAEEKVFRSDLVRPGEHHSVKMPDLLMPSCLATPVTIGRDVYLVGGVTGKVETARLVQVYNMDSGDCRTLPPSPQYDSEAVAIDGTLVLIGGRDSSTHKSTNMVSTWMAAEERWTQVLPPMKMKRLRPDVLLLNSHLFVFGGVGVDRKTRLDSFEVLDLNTKQWTEGRGGLPRPLLSPQLGVFGDYVMLYGGWTSAGHRVSRACYTVPVQALVDSVTNPLSPPIHWTPVQDSPHFNSALLTTSQGAVLLGGNSRDDQVTGAIHCFSSSGRSWEVISKLSEPRARPTVVAVSDKSFLVLGGVSDVHNSYSSLLKSVELISY